jgi:hypothetical protein
MLIIAYVWSQWTNVNNKLNHHHHHSYSFTPALSLTPWINNVALSLGARRLTKITTTMTTRGIIIIANHPKRNVENRLQYH